MDAMNALYAMECETVYEVNRTSETHGKLNSAPNCASNRYITEDAAYLLVPCYEFAQLSGIETPIITSCLGITEVAHHPRRSVMLRLNKDII